MEYPQSTALSSAPARPASSAEPESSPSNQERLESVREAVRALEKAARVLERRTEETTTKQSK